MRATKALITGGTALALALGGSAAALTVGQGVASSSTTSVSDQVATDLVFSREEERMAGDLYRLFAAQYPDQQTFQHIPGSEDRHFDHVGALLTSYGIADPSAGLPAGTYADPAVQQLYDQWKAEGLQSEQAALQVGVELETRDIADLKAMSERSDVTAVDATYQVLLNGSEHHLNAFTSAADGTLPAGARGANGGGRMGNGPNGAQSRMDPEDCPLGGTGPHGPQANQP